MSECFEFTASMTGSTSSGLLQPPDDLSPLPPRFLRHSENDGGHCHQPRRKMTPVTLAGQPMQLTPLWEHVVRTHKFPTEVDVRSIFMEISGRLRDPEWEVRQHALRVLVDVLPTLDVDVMDKVMQPVVPELINNLGHSAPAVRKGALDTLRVYIVNSRDRDGTVQRLIHDGLNRCGGQDVFQTNVTTGVILSAPSLLFPSSNSPRPSASIVREVTVALASRLVQVTHQEAVVKSLLKIREAVGADEFDAYLREYDENVHNHFQVLSEVYDVKSPTKSPKKRSTDRRKKEKFGNDARRNSQRDWDSDSDTSGIVEEEDEGGVMPPARVVLETEIKFNEETAITMTILEEKDVESEEDEEEGEDVESGIDHKNNAEMVEAPDDPLNDRRRTPRRVHFGGEIVKLRTPDSDETESVDVLTAKTRIPLPISPATKMPPKRLRRRSSSQPEMGKNTSSPILTEHQARRKSRSVSGSPRKEPYVYNADISPKKGILSRSSSPIFVIKPLDGPRNTKKRRNSAEQRDNVETSKNQRKINESATNMHEKNMIEVSDIQPAQIEARNVKEESTFVQSALNNLQTSGDIVSAKPEVKNSSSADEELVGEGKKTSETTSGRNFSKKSSRSEEKINRGQSASVQQVNPVGSESIDSVSESLKNVSEDAKISTNAIDDKNERKKAGKSRINSSRGSVDIDANKCDSIFGSFVDDNVAERNFGEQIEDTEMDQSRNLETKETAFQASEPNSLPQETPVFPAENLQEEGHHEKETEENFSQRSRTEISSADEKYNEQNSKNSVPDADSPTIQRENVTCSSSESEGKPQEPSWEELGLVGPEVLEDLHNKDDWRARVRGLERVASALRTPSALVAIEPRLGSLLHSVLGGERSCRVAAAGLAVAKVVIAGVSEEALKRRLPQLAWGLARQGGPNAAQLARIAMLRLKPALLLEQLLQPHCLGARNAKMRENALQLLIFSLVTFPSTEFVMDTVAFKVATMVGDRRRRVRQAALDTMAVLAQVYDSEDVLEAGKRAAKGRHDGESMIAAIRARLARKSLPLVSADGLVVYGLQISPTVQIVTGPDVDWIVAGSGSVSPGTGRTRGQIIAATTNPQNDKQTRNDNGNLWTNKSNLVALGVGLHPKNEQPIAWQIVPPQNQDDFHSHDDLHGTLHSNGTFHNAEKTDVNLNLDDQPSRFYNSPKRTYRVVENGTETIENDLDGNRTNFKANDSYLPNNVSYKTESRIPILNSRGTNTKLIGQNRDKPTSLESINAAFRKGTKDVIDSNSNKCLPREDNVGFRNMYQRRKQLQQQNNLHPVMLNQTTNQPSELIYSGYRTLSYAKLIDQDHISAEAREQRNQAFAEIQGQPYQRLTDNDRFSRSSDGRIKNPRAYSIDNRQQIFSKNAQPALPTYDTYNAFYNQQRRNGPVYRALQTAPGPLARAYEEYQHSNRRNFERSAYVRTRFDRGTRDAACQKVVQVQQISTDSQTNDNSSSEEQAENTFRRRLRSLSPSQFYHPPQFSRLTSKSQATSMYDIDKTSATQEFNERNKHHLSSQTDVDEIQLSNRDQSRIQGENVPKSNSSASSEASTITEPRGSVHMILDQQESSNSNSNSNSNSRSSTPSSQNGDKAFDIITTNTSPRGIIMTASNDPLGTSDDIPGSTQVSIGEVMSKEWSNEDVKRVENIMERPSDHVDFARNDENGNDTDDTFTIVPESAANRPRNSVVSISSQAERSKTPNEHLLPNYSDKSFEHASDTSDERILSTVLLNENSSFRQLDDEEEHQQREVVLDSNESNETAESETKENSTHNTSSVNTESSVIESLDDKSPIKDVAFSTIPPHPSITPVVQTEQTRRLPSRVPRRTVRHRSNSNRMQKPDKSLERTKPVVQQCFAQLESKDWEVAMKGLKALSQIAKQHPEYLDMCAAGIVGRLLGRHVKNLRSQVARAACLSAGDLFSAQIRGVDQDLDDIATPLLHRTADTNRFLRADCNSALDRMVEHLPPHKTIAVIVHRGANHQNAIVRAATARLLAQVVDRIGPDHAMILPRDVRDKLFSTGAKLLIDGNLDARNHAKKMFRRLTRCEGFRKALTDSVPDATLRHIDKALKSL